MKLRKLCLTLILLLLFTSCTAGGNNAADTVSPDSVTKDVTAEITGSENDSDSADGNTTDAQTSENTGSESGDTESECTTAAETAKAKNTDMTEVRVAVLSGTTGFGIAPLYMKNKEGKLENLNLSIDIYSDATLVAPLIISGNADIAAVPTNLAAVLYNKTKGNIRLIGVNTLGVLYLLENGNTVNSLSDLCGKTVYVPGQGTNPEYVLRALLAKAGIADKVTIDYSYGTPDELTSAAVTGKASVVLLPEPKVTAVTTKNKNIRVALDITKEWESQMGTELIQGCIVARKDFIENHPDALNAFLEEYKSSINSVVNGDPDSVAAAVVSSGIAASAALVKNALPRCNIVFMSGKECAASLTELWKQLYAVAPSSIGGTVPDENIFG